MNYINYLGQRLNIIRNNLNIENNIEVYEEQAFLKHKLVPNTIYLVVRFLSADIGLTGIKEQPVNIVVMSEQNSLENAKAIMQRFAETYNWKEETVGDTYLKQSYGTPFVLNNFEDVASGFRSVLYLSATLQLMENVVDVEDLEIDEVSIKPLAFSINYNMQGNTQQIPPKFLSSTVKSVSTLGFSLSLPLRSNYTKSIESTMSISITDTNVSVEEVGELYEVTIALNTKNMENIDCDIQYESLVVESDKIVITFTSQGYDDFDRFGLVLTYDLIFNLLQKFIQVALGKESGNVDFAMSFTCLGVDFSENVKCILCEINTAPNSIPRITLGVML